MLIWYWLYCLIIHQRDYLVTYVNQPVWENTKIEMSGPTFDTLIQNRIILYIILELATINKGYLLPMSYDMI